VTRIHRLLSALEAHQPALFMNREWTQMNTNWRNELR
jgi:hypothetical protein